MARQVVAIVEGHGEAEALPGLLRRLRQWLTPQDFADFPQPIRVHRDRFLQREDEFHRQMRLAAAKCGQDGWILILLDADDDCPVLLGEKILSKAQAFIPHRPISVVLANREFEAWFIACANALDGQNGFQLKTTIPPADSIRDAKGWLKKQMRVGAYSETTDQKEFVRLMDLQMAHNNSRSFRKLCAEWRKQMSR